MTWFALINSKTGIHEDSTEDILVAIETAKTSHIIAIMQGPCQVASYKLFDVRNHPVVLPPQTAFLAQLSPVTASDNTQIEETTSKPVLFDQNNTLRIFESNSTGLSVL